MRRFPLQTTGTHRPCGDCQACCTVLAIDELGKPPWTRCSNQCAQGCAIYESRPNSCRAFECLWQAGLLEGDERRRPDNLGVILELRTAEEALAQVCGARGAPYIQAWEVRAGALQEQNVEFLLNRLAERYVILKRPYQCADSGVIINRVGRPGSMSGGTP